MVGGSIGLHDKMVAPSWKPSRMWGPEELPWPSISHSIPYMTFYSSQKASVFWVSRSGLGLPLKGDQTLGPKST